MHPDTVVLMKKMIAFVKEYQLTRECSPSYEEIGAAIGRTKTYVGRLLLAAEARGLVRKPYGTRREIEVVQ